MASLIKSIGLAEVAFALGGMRATQGDALPRVAEPEDVLHATSEKKAASLSGEAKAVGQSVTSVGTAAEQMEAAIGKRIEEAVALKIKEIDERYRQEEKAVFAEAAERGYESGLRRATDEQDDRHQQLQTRVAQLQKSVEQAIADAFADVTHLACDISCAAVERILGQEIASGNAIAAVVKDTISRLENAGSIVVRVHPDDAVLLQKSNMHGASQTESARYRVEPDESITRGGCVVENSHGILDARLETRLDAFIQALRGQPSDHPEAAS
ncbi:MAG TPA: FliH/SctL family protein [Rhodocyclaceae bacterium]|nr:FliH/SctL family protein [Rhodocyclaceae bacterium]